MITHKLTYSIILLMILVSLFSSGCKESERSVLFEVTVFDGATQERLTDGEVRILGTAPISFSSPSILYDRQFPVDLNGQISIVDDLDPRVELIKFEYMNANTTITTSYQVFNCPDGSSDIISGICGFADHSEFRVELFVYN